MKGAVYSTNSAISFIAALSLLRAGGVWIPISPRNSVRDNIDTLDLFDCEVLFYQSSFADVATDAADRLGPDLLIVDIDDGPMAPLKFDDFLSITGPDLPEVDMVGSDLISIPLTGGTTGRPKGVMLTNRNFCALDYGMRERYRGYDLVIMCAAPMTHVAGRIALTSMSSGARFVILDQVDPQRVLRTIQDEKITDFFLPPTGIYSLLDQPNVREFDYGSLKAIGYGSAPMAPKRIREAIQVFGPVMRGGFGQTECPMFISSLSQKDHFIDGAIAPDSRLLSVGKATCISELAILSDDGSLLPPNELGEIAVKGPMVSEGYYRNPEETEHIRLKGWHLTGDIGYLNEDGYLYVVDRKKDMIITGGFNVYSSEVEQALMSIPGISVAVVVGVPSERWGEEVKAVIQTESDCVLTEDEVIAYSKDLIGSVKSPKSVEFTADIPRTSVGKIDKKTIRQRYWASTDKNV